MKMAVRDWNPLLLEVSLDIRQIRCESDRLAALHEIERLWSAEPDTPESDKLDMLATLVDAFERDKPGLPDLDPDELIRVTREEESYTLLEQSVANPLSR